MAILHIKSGLHKHDEYAFYFREQEPFMSPLLKKAFVVALVFHLVAYVAFSIHRAAGGADIVIPPVNVNADLNLIQQSSTVLASLGKMDEYGLLIYDTPILVNNYTQLDPNAWAIFQDRVILHKKAESVANPAFSSLFDRVEQKDLSLNVRKIALSKVSYSPIQIKLLGALADEKIKLSQKTQNWLRQNNIKRKQKNFHLQRTFIRALIQVDLATGKVVWWKAISSEADSLLLKVLEDAIAHISLNRGMGIGLITGEMELTLKMKLQM
ncbi:MAG: hypothetical protein K0S74_578 [Chlamydiales bacterium]|nr:hypothetical protein [Chlamydiales bacterium]